MKNNINHAAPMKLPKYIQKNLDKEAEEYFDTKSDPESAWCRPYEDRYVFGAYFSLNKMTPKEAYRIFGNDIQVNHHTIEEGPYKGTEYLKVEKYFKVK